MQPGTDPLTRMRRNHKNYLSLEHFSKSKINMRLLLIVVQSRSSVLLNFPNLLNSSSEIEMHNLPIIGEIYGLHNTHSPATS